MSLEEFQAQYKLATSIIEKWPAWKRNILRDSAKPTMDVPRTPITHNGTDEESRQAPKSNE